MSKFSTAPGAALQKMWNRLLPWPLGRWLFHRLLRLRVPYTGALGARVLSLEPGYARVALRDRRGVRNHLNSVHAVALVNLGELTSGLALTSALPPGVRGIVVHIGMDYFKKARGRLIAESRAALPPVIDRDIEHLAQAEIRDAEGEVVARAGVRWRLGPQPPR
jgi:acyl-coenzyme A thioesterase PaaI-like protein